MSIPVNHGGEFTMKSRCLSQRVHGNRLQVNRAVLPDDTVVTNRQTPIGVESEGDRSKDAATRSTPIPPSTAIIGNNSVERGNTHRQAAVAIPQKPARPPAFNNSRRSRLSRTARSNSVRNRPSHASPPGPRTAHNKPNTKINASAWWLYNPINRRANSDARARTVSAASAGAIMPEGFTVRSFGYQPAYR